MALALFTYIEDCVQRVSCKDPATLLFAVGVAGANVYNEGDNLGPPDYESVAKHAEFCKFSTCNQLS